MNNYSIRLFYFCSILCLFLTGCSGGLKVNETEIIVTMDGQPLEGVSVNLIPKDNNSVTAFGMTDSQGKCQTQTLLGQANGGTVIGEYVVTLSKTETKKTGKLLEGTNGSKIEETVSVELLPTIYTNAQTTPLTIVVKSGKNSFPFELNSQKR
ncbi:MAG: hypothetical protein LBC20_10050 [Planctomycetaceae bacterium]|jgi:5-hydroxyisourate hydrolase-like protein (transthyretin family)|nr:hypothetical protein [Planctomycetaceae bacterium]